MAKKQEKARPGTLRRVLRYIGRYKLLLPLSLLFALVTVALTLYIPIIVGEVIDEIGKETISFTVIADKLGLAAILILATALAQWLMSTINNRIAYHVVRDIREDAFEKIEHLPLSYIDTHAHGDTVNRVINDADQFTEGLLMGFTQLFTGILTIVGTLVFMFYLQWIVAIVVVVLTPMSLLIAKFIASRTHKMFRERSEAEAETTALIGEMIGNQKLVKAFTYEDEAVERFGAANEKLARTTLDAIFFSSQVLPATSP